jgi:hypothetical protein
MNVMSYQRSLSNQQVHAPLLLPERQRLDFVTSLCGGGHAMIYRNDAGGEPEQFTSFSLQ